jgi:Cu/Ag efflux protein CusF
MPAMEMEWSVQKRSMLDKVKVGDKVNFVVVETGKGEILTELKKAQ